MLPVAQDYKRLSDGDKGPNTGGMGAFAPVKSWQKHLKNLEEKVVKPSVAGLVADKLAYRGVLYIGVMMVKGEPFVLEYNVRFGDPECQVLLPLLQGDWAQVFKDVATGRMPKLKWKPQTAVCVVLAAPGYPDDPVKGMRIEILSDKPRAGVQRGAEAKRQMKKFKAEQAKAPSAYLLHAGTASRHGILTNGGRVMNAVAVDTGLAGARKKAYEILKRVTFDNMHFRTDIGLEAGAKPAKVTSKKAPLKAASNGSSKKSKKAPPKKAVAKKTAKKQTKKPAQLSP
jgi:phosphoribosylamine--glycine ligase